MSDELFILNCADMSVNSIGQNCSFAERLADIVLRYEENSTQYKKCADLISEIQKDQRFKHIAHII